jgi:hypothetical protein
MDQIYFLPKPFALDDLVNKIQDMVLTGATPGHAQL